MTDGKPQKGKAAHPPWYLIDQAKGTLDPWVNPSWLLMIPGFCFGWPNGMADNDTSAMASPIVQGELGLIGTEYHFHWEGQVIIGELKTFSSANLAKGETR